MEAINNNNNNGSVSSYISDSSDLENPQSLGRDGRATPPWARVSVSSIYDDSDGEESEGSSISSSPVLFVSSEGSTETISSLASAQLHGLFASHEEDAWDNGSEVVASLKHILGPFICTEEHTPSVTKSLPGSPKLAERIRRVGSVDSLPLYNGQTVIGDGAVPVLQPPPDIELQQVRLDLQQRVQELQDQVAGITEDLGDCVLEPAMYDMIQQLPQKLRAEALKPLTTEDLLHNLEFLATYGKNEGYPYPVWLEGNRFKSAHTSTVQNVTRSLQNLAWWFGFTKNAQGHKPTLLLALRTVHSHRQCREDIQVGVKEVEAGIRTLHDAYMIKRKVKESGKFQHLAELMRQHQEGIVSTRADVMDNMLQSVTGELEEYKRPPDAPPPPTWEANEGGGWLQKKTDSGKLPSVVTQDMGDGKTEARRGLAEVLRLVAATKRELPEGFDDFLQFIEAKVEEVKQGRAREKAETIEGVLQSSVLLRRPAIAEDGQKAETKEKFE